MRKQLSMLAVMSLVVAMTGPLHADDGWSLSKLNPFKKKSTSTATSTRARASYSDQSNQYGGFPYVSMPTWGTQSTTSSAPKRKEPSTLTKLNRSTKEFFGKTKSVLMPWTKSSKSKSRSSRSASSSKKSSSSFLTSWLPKKEEKKRPKTVKDFLAQPRPGF